MRPTEASEKIISLDAARTMRKVPAISVVEDYWECLRDGGRLPARADIDPRALTGVLAHTFIVERIAPGLARLRVAGSRLNDLIGMEARGMPLSALFVPQARPVLARALETVFSDPAVIQMSLDCPGGIGKPQLTGGMVLLTLTDAKGAVTRALGALAMTGRIGRTPRRPDIRSQTRRGLLRGCAELEATRQD